MASSTNDKSEGRKVMQRLFPSAFLEGSEERGMPRSAVVFEDCLVGVRSSASSIKPDAKTGRVAIACGADFVRTVKRRCEESLKKVGCETYALCFDKKWVTILKAEEQTKRDEESMESGRLESGDDLSTLQLPPLPYLSLVDPLPSNWSELLSDRDTFRPWVLAWTCEQLLASDDPSCRLSIPENKSVLIDGHYFSPGDVERIREAVEEETGDASSFLAEPEAAAKPCKYPILATGGLFGEPLSAKFQVAMKNTVGEADFGVFFLWKKLKEANPSLASAEFDSTDTDLMWLGMILREMYRDEIDLGCMRWKYSRAGRNRWGRETKDSWVDLRLLGDAVNAGTFADDDFLPPNVKKRPEVVHEVEERKRLEFANAYKGLTYGPVWQVAATAWMAKCDYTLRHNNITHWRCLEAIFRHASRVGPLIVGSIDDDGEEGEFDNLGPTVDGGAYKRLFRVAYVSACTRFSADEEDVERVTDKEILRRTSPSRGNPKKTAAGKEPLSAAKLWPSDRLLQLKMRHLQATLLLVSQMGESKMVDPPVLKYGFALRDPSKDQTRDNVVHLRE